MTVEPHVDRMRTITDAGRDLGVSRWTIYRLIDKGLLRTVEVDGGRRIFDSEIERFRRTLPEGQR